MPLHTKVGRQTMGQSTDCNIIAILDGVTQNLCRISKRKTTFYMYQNIYYFRLK